MRFPRLRAASIAIASAAGPAVLTAFASSLRIRLRMPSTEAVLAAGGRAAIFAVWHDQLLIALLLGIKRVRACSVLVSEHPDAEAIARAVERAGFGVIRGSSTHGGRRALAAMAAHLERGGRVIVTPDGPRGPRRRAGDGVLLLAERSGAPIVPVASAVRPRILVPSWDRLQIPLPFGRGDMVDGAELKVPTRTGRAGRESLRRELEGRLNLLSEDVERAVRGRS